MLFSAVDSELPGVTRQRDRLWIARTSLRTAAVVTDVEQKIFAFTLFIFTAFAKVALGTPRLSRPYSAAARLIRTERHLRSILARL